MESLPLTLAGTEILAHGDGTLTICEGNLLVLGDLHLGKSERHARRGGCLLPPYETLDTLQRLDAAIERHRPARIVALGDSFDDDAAALALGPQAMEVLDRITQARPWIWIAGNHDPAAGEALEELRADGGLVLRHIGTGEQGEVSAHWHPKIAIAGRTRACFVLDRDRLILPAFGTYTGGLHADQIPGLSAHAVAVTTGARPLRIPVFTTKKSSARSRTAPFPTT